MSQAQLWEVPPQPENQELAPIPPARDGTPPEEWLGGVHPDGRLELTRGFYLYADKLSRVLAYVERDLRSGEAVYEQLARATGMTAPRVKALAQFGVYMGLLTPRALRVTPLGRLILESDPFFDRTGTLWLLHYVLASNPWLVVWNYMCNAVLPGTAEISRTEAMQRFLPFVGRWSEATIYKKVRKELRAFFISYVREMFTPLNYLRELRDNVYAVPRSVEPVPPLVLLAACLAYRDRHQPGSTSVEIPTLVYADHSPGRIMRQGESAIRRTLDTLHEMRWLSIESKANLDQVRFHSGTAWLGAVRAYYQERQDG